MSTLDPKLVRYQALMEMIKPLLVGHPPEVQGCVLADLLAYWLAGHPEKVRPAILKFHIEMMQQLVELNAKELRSH